MTLIQTRQRIIALTFSQKKKKKKKKNFNKFPCFFCLVWQFGYHIISSHDLSCEYDGLPYTCPKEVI